MTAFIPEAQVPETHRGLVGQVGTLFMAFHATQGPMLARPDRLRDRVRRRDPVHGAAADRRPLLHRAFPSHVSNGVDYSWLVGLVVSGVVYWTLSRSLDRSSEQAAIEASEQELKELSHQ